MGVCASILSPHHHPLRALLPEVIVHHHARCRVTALRGNRNRSIGLIALKLNRSYLYIHTWKVQSALCLAQMVENSLTDRIIALRAAIARDQWNN